MNTDNLRFMKYIRVMMLMLLTLWCKEGVGQTFDAYPGATEVIHKYQKYDNLICDLTGEMSSILTKLGYSQASDMDNKGGYIRWSILDAEGNIAAILANNVYYNDDNQVRLNYDGIQGYFTENSTTRTPSEYYYTSNKNEGVNFVNYGSNILKIKMSVGGM